MGGERLFESERAAANFSEALKTERIGKRLHYFPSTGSTNDLALQAARGAAPDGTVFIADAQVGGRGRRGRSWDSPPGLGLLFSVILDVATVPPQRLSWVPMAAGLSCVEGLARTTPVNATIKWPNDLVIPDPISAERGGAGWRKLGGILCESFFGTRAGERSVVVAGIGLNINHAENELPEFTKAQPSSVRLESGAFTDRRAVLAAVLETLETQVDALRSDAGAERIRQAAQTALSAWWTPSRVLQAQVAGSDGDGENGRVVAGRFSGLNEAGWLRMVLKDGTEQIYADAEILSLR